jgi:hypothetical protein
VNPDAAAFVPGQPALNPNVGEFVPSQQMASLSVAPAAAPPGVSPLLAAAVGAAPPPSAAPPGVSRLLAAAVGAAHKDAGAAPPPPAAAEPAAAPPPPTGGGGKKGKKKKGRDASHLLGFTSERADAVGADENESPAMSAAPPPAAASGGRAWGAAAPPTALAPSAAAAAAPPPAAAAGAAGEAEVSRWLSAVRRMSLQEMYGVRLLSSAPAAPPKMQTFTHEQSIKGRPVNVLDGLQLHREVLSPVEQRQLLAYAAQFWRHSPAIRRNSLTLHPSTQVRQAARRFGRRGRAVRAHVLGAAEVEAREGAHHGADGLLLQLRDRQAGAAAGHLSG